jgi:conjugal transfer mating pair stabilization protein TraG
MDYVIHTFGGGDVLIQVFNALGRLFANDSEYFTPVGKFALTVGGIWAGTRAIFKGNIGIFGMEWFFPSFFAFVFLFAPKANVWIKDEVTMNAPVKVDNIPIGIAFFSSISSKMSYTLSELLEQHLLPPDEGLSIRKTGIMFGAKAVGKIRDVQIQNPVTLGNTKEFMRQCYTKPYVIGNINGKKIEAQTTDDIFGFIESNVPNNFGIYYKDPDTSAISFKTCKQAIPLVKAAIKKELNDGLLTQFAAAIGMQPAQPEMLKSRLKAMTGDMLRYLKKDQADIHEWMKQAMLLNANRESYDDWREKHGLARVYPQLIAMTATRGMFQQSFGYLTAGEMAANMLPIIQSAFTSLIICLIFIVFPMSMLPGGFKILKMWIMLMIWVSSWPVFFTIVHCLGMMSLAGKLNVFGSTGISLLSQGGFSEITLHTYATYQMFAASVPVLAWAVLKGGEYATTSLAGNFSPVSAASSIGAGVADDNINIGGHNVNNRSKGQVNEAPSLQLGDGIIDDGGTRVTATAGGEQVIMQHIDSLGSNFNATQMSSDSIQSQISDQQSRMQSLTNRSSELSSTESRQATALAHRFADGTATVDGMSTVEQQSLRETLSQGLTSSEGVSSREGKDSATTAGLSLGGGKGIGGNVGVNAANTTAVGREKSAVEQKAYGEAMEKVKSAARNNSINSTSDEVKSLSRDLSSTIGEQESVGKEIAKTEQTMQSLNHSKSYLDQNSATFNRNMNDEMLEEVKRTQPGIHSKAQAADWVQAHPQESANMFKQLVGLHNQLGEKNWGNISGQAQGLAAIDNSVKSTPITTKSELKNKGTESLQNAESTKAGGNATNEEIPLAQQVKNNLNDAKKMYNNSSVEQILNNELDNSEKAMHQDLQAVKPGVNAEQEKLDKRYEDTNDSTIIRTKDMVEDNFKNIDKTLDKLNKENAVLYKKPEK